MRNWILCVAALLWIAYLDGCATHPPAHIIDDRYINFEYGYSIEVPEGWEVHEKVPDDLNHRSSWSDYWSDKKISLTLVNKQTNGLIMCVSKKRNRDISNMTNMTDKQAEELAAAFNNNLDQDPDLRNLQTETKSRNLVLTNIRHQGDPKSFRPEPIFSMTSEIEHGIGFANIDLDLFMYPCHGKKACVTGIMLLSLIGKGEENLPTFRELSDSLLGHDNSRQ